MRTHHKKADAAANEGYRHLIHAPEKDTNQTWQIERNVHQTHFIHKSTVVINAKKHWTPVQIIKHI